jgi:hypothetical protein
LRELLTREGRCGALHLALVAVVRGGCLGLLPEALAPILCAASLIPLSKPCGGVRPIAVGETLRRLVGKALLKTPAVQRDVAGLAPRQTGVAVKSAAQLIGLGLQQLVAAMDPSGDWIIVQVDMTNAFNSLHRESMLEGARRKVPGAYNWLRYCYSGHVPLFCQGELLLMSETGVHQGDACGPLGFSLGLDVALDAVADLAPPLTWGVWYLDDGTLVGPAAAVLTYLGALKEALAKVGLELNASKCKAWGPGLRRAGEAGATYPDEGCAFTLYVDLRKVYVYVKLYVKRKPLYVCLRFASPFCTKMAYFSVGKSYFEFRVWNRCTERLRNGSVRQGKWLRSAWEMGAYL